MGLRHLRDFIAVGEEQMGDPERIGDRQDDRVVLQESCEGDLACSSAMRTRDAIGVDRAARTARAQKAADSESEDRNAVACLVNESGY